jgi:hypothetical protein
MTACPTFQLSVRLDVGYFIYLLVCLESLLVDVTHISALFFSVLFAGQKNAAAFFIETPIFLPTGPARINFTRGDGDPARAYFNIAVASNASRLADNVDTSLGFVDVNIGVLPG